MSERYPELTGLRGGRKDKWLRLHKPEVLTYHAEHGREATLKMYHMKPDTLDRLLEPGSKTIKHENLSAADRAIARVEMIEAGLQETRREVREMKESYNKFVPFLSDELSKKFFTPLLMGKIDLPPEIEYKPEDDHLKLSNFEGESGK